MLSRYRHNVGKNLYKLINELGPLSSVLDFGAGNGQFASNISKICSVGELKAIDVVPRKHSFYPVQIYDGTKLPFGDGCFDLVYAIDTIHHCNTPVEILRDLLRCARKFFILKDHVFWTKTDSKILSILDEIGNRRLGIKSSYKYQYAWNWFTEIRSAGFELSRLIHPAYCEFGPIGWIANRMQFFAVFRRVTLSNIEEIPK